MCGQWHGEKRVKRHEVKEKTGNAGLCALGTCANARMEQAEKGDIMQFTRGELAAMGHVEMTVGSGASDTVCPPGFAHQNMCACV